MGREPQSLPWELRPGPSEADSEWTDVLRSSWEELKPEKQKQKTKQKNSKLIQLIKKRVHPDFWIAKKTSYSHQMPWEKDSSGFNRKSI